MDKKRLEYFKDKLLKERQTTIESIDRVKEREEDITQQLDNELSSYGNHPGNIGTELYMKEDQMTRREELEDKILDIDQSLKDIEAGEYGYCNNCDKMISEKRLEIIPYAKTCLDCSGEDGE